MWNKSKILYYFARKCCFITINGTRHNKQSVSTNNRNLYSYQINDGLIAIYSSFPAKLWRFTVFWHQSNTSLSSVTFPRHTGHFAIHFVHQGFEQSHSSPVVTTHCVQHLLQMFSEQPHWTSAFASRHQLNFNWYAAVPAKLSVANTTACGISWVQLMGSREPEFRSETVKHCE